MASFVFFIFTIFLLPVALSAAECNECFTDQGGFCNSKPTNCSATCLGFLSVANLSIENRFTTSFTRSCVDTANHLTGSFHFNFGDERILDFRSEVCNETGLNCNFGIEGDNMRIYENGKSCPKCYRTGFDNCESDGEVLCLGDIVNCTELNGEITNVLSGATIPFAGKGCVSRSVCDLKGKSFRRGSYTFKFKELQCSKASGILGPQVAFFVPCILGIFAVKILS